MFKRFSFKRFIIVCMLLYSSVVTADETITILSAENGSTTGTMLVNNNANGPFPNPFTPNDFNTAANGQSAVVISNPIRNWKQQLDFPFTHAQWIATNSSTVRAASALFSFPFTVTEQNFSSATLTFHFLVDNQLGESTNQGVIVKEGLYVNDNAIPNSVGPNPVGGGFNPPDKSIGPVDITNFVVSGNNRLQVYLNDISTHAGIVFVAVIEITSATNINPESVPSVSALGLVAMIGLFGLLGFGREKTKLF